ncbi:MAG TPA: type II secretion system protein GspJ [Phycisphaerae bacterium]|nr:type II secretion system protein GspJ [Phycisphaerae bacterium]HRY68902.1 type II secretion system protein GspJ [Phycisphaerae bacterium]HSA25729.1 type II secretion system protein GspJ [Phycisphaerae bacterium]
MIRRRGPSRGFTLLEVTVALAMMAMMALSMYASMAVCMKARRSAMAAVQPVRAATIAMELVCRDLESILPPTGILSGPFLGVRQMGATGDADYLDFYSLGSDDDELMPEGIHHVELGLRTDVTPQVLVRHVTRNLLARTAVEPEEEILCREVRSLSLRYFDGANWLEEWDSTAIGDVLPAAIMVQIELEDGVTPSTEITPNRAMRIIPLACAKPAEATTGGSLP